MHGTTGADSPIGKDSAAPSKLAPGEDVSLCTVAIYGDFMASNGTAVTPSMMLQLIRPNLLVVADHSVPGMRLSYLAPVFSTLTRSAHYVIIENGVIDAWRWENINTVINEYYAIIQRMRDEGRIPVLTGFFPGQRRRTRLS